MKTEHKYQSQSIVDSIRLKYTDFTQEQFAVACKIPLATYRRMAKSGEMRLNPIQYAYICRVCGISLKQLLRHLGIDVSNIPDDE